MSWTAAPPVCGLSPQRQVCRRLFCDRRRTSWRLPPRALEGLAQPGGEILARYWQAARNTTVSIGQTAGAWRCPCSQSEALHFSAVRTSSGWPSANPFALQALTAALAQSAAPLPGIAHGPAGSITFEVADFTTASAAFFIACWVAAAASLAASADFFLKSSSLVCCSFHLALKSATESFHQRESSSKNPRFSGAGAGEAALGGGGCVGDVAAGAGVAGVCVGAGCVAGGAVAAGGAACPCARTAPVVMAIKPTVRAAPITAAPAPTAAAPFRGPLLLRPPISVHPPLQPPASPPSAT